MLADRYSRKWIITASLVAWSGMTVLTGFAQNFFQLALARVGVAIGEAGGTPPAYSLIADYYPLERRGTAAAIYSLGVPIGILTGFLIGGFVSQAYGWRAAFFVVGAPGLLLALLLIAFLPDVPRAVGSTNENAQAPGLGDVFKVMLRQKTIVHLLIAGSLANFVGYAHLTWLGSFLGRTHGMDIATRSVVLALIIGCSGIVGNLLSGRLVDVLGRRDVRWKLWLLAVGTAITLPFAVFAFLSDNVVVAMAAFVIPAIAGSFWLAPIFALLPSLVGIRMRATAASIFLMVVNLLGMSMGPWYVGIASDFLTPIFQGEALRYALLSCGLFSIWSIYHYASAARILGADLAFAETLDGDGPISPPNVPAAQVPATI
jgi:predicted MFS family arabinose efflux permease